MIQIGENCRAGKFGKENPLMRSIITGSVCAVVVAFTASHGASAQPSYYDDIACRQYADSQITPLRDQVNSQAVGNTLLGAGLGAAVGAAVGGGRGAGIGAASGAIFGTGVGAATAQTAEQRQPAEPAAVEPGRATARLLLPAALTAAVFDTIQSSFPRKRES